MSVHLRPGGKRGKGERFVMECNWPAAQDAGRISGAGVPGARLEQADAAETRFGDVSQDARRLASTTAHGGAPLL